MRLFQVREQAANVLAEIRGLPEIPGDSLAVSDVRMLKEKVESLAQTLAVLCDVLAEYITETGGPLSATSPTPKRKRKSKG